MNKELKIGIVGFITIMGLFIGLNYLKGLSIFDQNRSYHSKYDNISGLTVGSSVFLNGFQVGMVSNIKLLKTDIQKVLVTINLKEDLNLPSNTICKIVNQDLMGTKSIDLILGDSDLVAKLGDTLVSSVEGSLQEEVNAQILPLKIKTEELIISVDSVMTIITAILNKDARENLRNSMRSLDNTFILLNETMFKIDQIIDQNDERITSIVENIESHNKEISNILKNFSNISNQIASSNIQNLLISLAESSKKINDSDGSFGQFVNDKELYLNLKNSSKELEVLIRDIKKNPGRYVNFSLIGGGNGFKSKKEK